MGTRTAWLALAVLLPFAAAAAQQRKPCFVTVVDADDRPLAGAAVTLVDIGCAGTAGTTPLDVVAAITDARGRCQPAVLVGRLYTMSAIGPPDAAADGSRLVTEPTDRGACGVVVELCALHRWVPRLVRVVDSDEMRPAWSRGLHVLAADTRTLDVLAVDENATAMLPPTAWAPVWLGIRDASGTLLQTRCIEPHVASPTLTFPAPASAHVRVRGPDGAPAAGAHVAASLGSAPRTSDGVIPNWSYHFRRLATGGASGDVAVSVHEPGRERAVSWLAVGAPGCAPTYLPSLEVKGSDAATPLVVQLEAACELRGTLRGVAANETASVRAFVHVSRHLAEGIHRMEVPLDVGLAGESLRLDAPGGAKSCRLVVQLAPRDDRAVPRAAVISCADFGSLPDVDLRRLRQFPLTVRTADDSLASGAEVLMFVPRDVDSTAWKPAHQVVANLSGRVDVLVDDNPCALYVGTGDAHAFVFLGADRESGPIEVVVAPVPTLRCRCVDPDGKPVRGASVESGAHGGGFSGVLRGPEGWAKEWIAQWIAWPLAARARSGRDGVLHVPVQDWRPWRATAQLRAGVRTSTPFPLRPGVELGDVVLR